MKSYSPKEVIDILLENGWYEKRIRGSHHQFVKLNTKQIVTVSTSKKTVPIGTLKIYQNNLELFLNRREK